MTFPHLPEAEPRLQRRYYQLVVSHLSSVQKIAAGVRAPAASDADPFAATQAAWRFYANPRVSLCQLAQPLIDCARAGVSSLCDAYTLVALDFCPLHFGGHHSKPDRVALAHYNDLGYDLLSALAISDRDGSPLAPLCLDLRAADGVHSTRTEQIQDAQSKLDGITPLIDHVANLQLARQPVYIIDREADSVGHYRQWHSAGRLFLIRADDQRRVLHNNQQETRLGTIAEQCKRRGLFKQTRQVQFKGKPATQFVAETSVILHRPARTHRIDPVSGKAKHRNQPGEPLSLRLIISQVRDQRGKVLAQWLLLSNLPQTVTAATIALWYYWRWRIESYHKLLKGAGQQIEQWQQETAQALARRLTVASMACVVVWHLARDQRPAAAELRNLLVRLSGRQMKRGPRSRGFTEPALLAGLGILIPMLQVLEEQTPAELRRIARTALPELLRREDG